MFTDGTFTKESMRMHMPAWFKAAMNETYGHEDISEEKPAAGTPVRSGDEVRVIFAKHALSAGINLDQIDLRHATTHKVTANEKAAIAPTRRAATRAG